MNLYNSWQRSISTSVGCNRLVNACQRYSDKLKIAERQKEEQRKEEERKAARREYWREMLYGKTSKRVTFIVPEKAPHSS